MISLSNLLKPGKKHRLEELKSQLKQASESRKKAEQELDLLTRWDPETQKKKDAYEQACTQVIKAQNALMNFELNREEMCK